MLGIYYIYYMCSYSFEALSYGIWLHFLSPHLDEWFELGGYQASWLTNLTSITYCHINGMLILTRKKYKNTKA